MKFKINHLKMKLLYFVLICLVAISHNANSSNTEYLSETQKEPVFEGGEQRKLQEEKNYIIIYYNGETKYTSFLNEKRYNISKIVLGSEDKGPEEQFTISSSSGLEVHFNEVIKSLDFFFSKDFDPNAINIISVDFSNFNWSNLNRMYCLFEGCSSLASIDFSNYDLSKVINMKYAFNLCSSLKSVTLPKNLSSVEEMENMFSECTSLVSIDLSNIDLPKVTNMKFMFSGCSKLEIVIFPETTQNLPDTSNMFQSCTALKSIDFSNADLSKVTSMEYMFKGCTLLESVTFPENLQNLETIKFAFSRCSSLKSIDFSNCNLTKLTYLNNMLEFCTSLESVSFPESLTNVDNMQNLFQECSSLQSIDLSNINLSKTRNFDCMFQSCSKLESVIFPRSGPQSLSSMIKIMKDCSSLTSIDLSMFTLSKDTSLNFFIDGCDSLVAIDFPIFDIKSSEIYGIFFYSPYPIFHFKYLNISGFSGESSDFATLLNNFYQLGLASLAVCGSDKKIIRSVGALLYKQRVEMDIDFCCNYTECRVIKDPNYIIVNFNRDCTYTNGFENDYRPNIYSVFLDGEEKDRNEQLDIKKGSKLVIHFTAPLTDFSNFFSSQYDSNVKNIISMDFSNFNSSLINKFTSAFKGCTSLKSLDLSSFKVTSETVISNMIEDCSSLVSVDISNFDLTNKEINKIFKNIGKLQYVSLINCLGETNDIYTFLNNIKGLNNEKKFLCINDTKFNDVDSQYKESNNGDSIENIFERCCYFDIENAACKYLLVSFNNECSYESGFENVCRANIDKIILDDAKKSKNDILEIKAGSKMKIYFNKAPTNFSNFFDVQYDANVANIDSIDFSHMDLTKVIDMGYLFKGCSSLESITFSKATPTAIKNMAGMLSDCTGIKSIDLSNFIIPGGANMFPMFLGCNNLVAFDLPKIYNFLNGQFLLQLYNQMFPQMGPPSSQPTLKYMNLCSLSGLNFEGIANSIGLFFLINTIPEKVFICLNEQDFSAFNTSFEIVGNKNPYPDIMPGELPKPNINFERCCDFNLETSECELPPTSNNDSDLIDSDNYIVVYFNGNIDYSNFMNRYRTGVAGIVANGKKLNIEDSFTIQSGTSLQIHFNETVVSLEHFFDSITDENAASISSIDFSHFDSSKLSNMNSIFSGCFDLVTVDFTNFNWTNIQDIGYMFYGCDSFKSIDLSNADISKIANMERVFQSCDSLESVIFPESGPQNVENIDYMFYYCSALKSVDLSKFNLSKITDMYGMFDGCYSLESVAFPESTQNVEDMGSMFSGCSKLKSIDLSKSNLSKVTNMEGMFEDCEALESVAFPVSGPQNIEDMSNIFYGCSALKSMNFSNFDLAKATNMDNMFQSCSKLESVILPESGPQNLQSMSNIINGCSSLTSIDFSMIKLLESTKIESFIAACDSLVEIDFPILDLKTYNFSEKFGPIQGGLHLKYINLLGTTGTNENFADLFKQLYNNYNLTSLSVCVNDEEIIESAQSILSGTNKVDMELKYCCNYPICKIIETTNMPSTSYLENIEIMTSTIIEENKPSTNLEEIQKETKENIEPKTTNVVQPKTTNLPDIETKSTTMKEIKIETTIVEEVQINTTNIADIEIKSTTIKEIQIESTIREEKETEIEKERQPEEEKEQKTEKEQESKPEKTSEKEKETVKETSKDEKTYAPTNIPTTVQPETEKQEETDKKEDTPKNIPTTVQPETEKQEETDKKEDTPKNITLSYRQINNFEQNDTSKIEFDLYTLTMEEELLKGFKIPIYVNLIHTNGTRDEEPTEAICILNHDIKGNTASSLAYFRCSIENLEEIYYSFRYNYSDYIIGVPNDEIALDPILTKKSIKKNEIVDSSDESNLPPTFVFGSMIHENCKDNGVLIFLGNIYKTIDDPIVFTLSLLNPEGTSLYCNLNGNEGKLECKTDRQIEDKTIRIAQTIIKEGIKEVLLLGSFMPEDQVTCANAIYKESTEKSSITVSFRQVSHFEKKSNGFSFYFISLLSKEYKKGYNLILKMDVEINGKYTEKNANCILNDDAYPAAGAVVQGNFLCSVDLSPSEYTNTNFTTIRVSQANDKICGISNLDKITENPYKTDLAIKEIKEKRAKNEYISEYVDIVDYLEEEVKINPIFNIDYIKDSDTCGETGKFILVGATTDDITEDFKFDLPLTYPNDILKCEMIASKKNDKIEITCKTTFGFKDVQNIIFEQRLITKKNKELVIIPNKQINLDQMINCVDYNSAKIQLVKQRSNSGLFFLQVSKFAPLLNSFKFFIALTKRETKVPFKKTHELPIKLKFSSKMFLRNLEEVLSGVKAKCDINNELQTDYAAGYDCANSDSFSGTPQSMEIETAKIEDIGGIPESANPDKLNYNIDYSLLQNLKTIDDLPTVEIQNINADTCSENGEFNMTAILNKNGNLKSIYSDVWITFSVPETRGLCEIIIKDKNMSMTCQNEENFYITQIFIERQSVQDSEGNEIFFIESFINPEQFACDISLNLATKTKNTNLENDTTLTDTSTDGPVKNSISRRAMFRNNNSGMSGGAIAAIVISFVVAIAVVSFLISLNLKNKKNKIHEVGESSILGFVAKGKENSINKM